MLEAAFFGISWRLPRAYSCGLELHDEEPVQRRCPKEYVSSIFSVSDPVFGVSGNYYIDIPLKLSLCCQLWRSPSTMTNDGRRAPFRRHACAKDRRERRLPSEARLRLQLCRDCARIVAHRGGHDSRVNTISIFTMTTPMRTSRGSHRNASSSKSVTRSSLCWCLKLFWIPAPALVTEYVAPANAVTFDNPALVIDYVAPAPAVTFNEPAPVIVYVAPLSAVTFDEPSPVIEYVGPASAVFYPTPAPVSKNVAPAPPVTYTALSPVIEHVALAPAVTFAAPAPGIEDVALAPAVTFAAPAPGTEDVARAPAVTFAAPAPVIVYGPVIEYIAPAPAATCSAPSQQFSPVYTMAAVTTGVNLDTSGLVKSQHSVPAVEDCPSRIQPSASGTVHYRGDIVEIPTVHEPVTPIHGLSPLKDLVVQREKSSCWPSRRPSGR